MAQVGRKTKLDDALQKKLCDALAIGMTDKTACAFAGVGHTAFYRWLERGENANRGRLKEFREAIVDAREQGCAAATIALRSHFRESWQACIAFLERRDRQNWGRELNLQVQDMSRVEVVEAPTFSPEGWVAEAEVINEFRAARQARLDKEAAARAKAAG